MLVDIEQNHYLQHFTILLLTCFDFPLFQLTRKNLMAKNLKRLKKQVEREHGKLEALKYAAIDFRFFSLSEFLFLINILFFKLLCILFVSVCVFFISILICSYTVKYVIFLVFILVSF